MAKLGEITHELPQTLQETKTARKIKRLLQSLEESTKGIDCVLDTSAILTVPAEDATRDYIPPKERQNFSEFLLEHCLKSEKLREQYQEYHKGLISLVSRPNIILPIAIRLEANQALLNARLLLSQPSPNSDFHNFNLTLDMLSRAIYHKKPYKPSRKLKEYLQSLRGYLDQDLVNSCSPEDLCAIESALELASAQKKESGFVSTDQNQLRLLAQLSGYKHLSVRLITYNPRSETYCPMPRAFFLTNNHSSPHSPSSS